MKYWKRYLCFAFLFLMSFQIQATHDAGGDLSYTCLGNNHYQVKLKLYRDCNGINAPGTASVNVIGGNTCSGFSQGLPLNKISVVDVPTVCSSVMGQTSCHGGTLPGYEEHTYTGVLDLSGLSPGCTWTASYSNCCRNSAITNLVSATSSNFYIETAFLGAGTVTCNSSPEFGNMPIFVTCDTLAYTLSNAVIEADGDSIVYSLINPLSGINNPIPFVAGFSANNPLSTVSGVSLDAVSGQLSFTPSGYQVAVVDVLAQEYRNGVLIGYTQRSMQIIVTTCSNQHFSLDTVHQVLNGLAYAQGTSTVFYACPGEDLDFRLILSDPDTIDTLSLATTYSSLLQVYPNASINVTYPSSSNNAFIYVFIPGVQNKGFSLAFTDNSCPIANTQSFSFLVLPDSNCASIGGRIAVDSNANCLVSPLEPAYIDAIVAISKGNFITYASPDINGSYSAVVDTGSYSIQVLPLHPYWAACISPVTANLPVFGNNVTVDFAMQASVLCPLMQVDIAAPVLLHCMSNYYSVHYCNQGTVAAVGAYIEVELDTLFVIDSTTHPIANQLGSTYTFNLGNMPIGHCGIFRIYGTLDPVCDSSNFGRTHCATAHIYPDTICISNPLWSGADLEVEAQCTADSVAFRIVNKGQQGMLAAQNYWVIEDDIIFQVSPNNILLPSNTATSWYQFPATGATYRLEIDQVPHHPWTKQVSKTIEGCQAPAYSNLPISLGFVNMFSPNDAAPFLSINCQQNVGSWDPNDKQAFPKGYANAHYIEANVDLKYRIRFQNTGTYLAANIVVVDTLSAHLNPATFVPTAASHAYSWRMLDQGVVEFRFNNIMLPDSGSNQTASHGFVDFRIQQKANNSIGTIIYNQAAIYFDNNSPIITNQTYHRVGENFIVITGTERLLLPDVQVKVYPNPFQRYTTIEVLGDRIYKNIALEVFDVTGKLVQQIQNNNAQQILLHRNAMPQGLYFYRLLVDGQLLNTGKLLVH